MEVLLHQVDQLLMLDGASAHNHDVLAKVVRRPKINDHVSLYLIDIIDVAKDGLSHHVLPVNIIVHVLHESLHVIVIRGLKLLPDRVLLHLHVVVIEVGVAHHVTQDFDRLRDTILEGKNVIECVLSRGVSVELSPHVFNLLLNLRPRSSLSSLEMQML